MLSTAVFDPEVTSVIHELRGALSDLVGGVGVDIRRPQDVSRRLSLDKSLAWKLSRIVTAGDSYDALRYMPGDAGLAIILRAVDAAGGTEPRRCRAAGAIRDFQSAVLRHVGDRKTLDLIVDGLDHEKAGERLAVSRKLAFRGNSGIWGLQAKARLNTVVLAPNRDNPELVDSVLVGGWVDFRRIRGDARWVLFRRQPFDPDGAMSTDLSANSTIDSTLLPEFCSESLPPINIVREGTGLVYELGPTAVGNGGLFTYIFSSTTRAVGPRSGQVAGEVAQFPVHISAPAEHLQFDMLVHRDCSFAVDQRVDTYGVIAGDSSAMWNDRGKLPVHLERSDLGSCGPVVSSTLYPRYSELVNSVFAKVGWTLRDFVGTRYTMEYPPFPSTVVVCCPLDPPKSPF